MTHGQKVARFIEEAASKGVGRNTAAPPLFSLAWKLRVPIPPPHFLSFAQLTLLMGSLFGVIWGVLMRLWFWQGVPLSKTILPMLAAGGLFGVWMAIFYRRQARKLHLPQWHHYRGKN